MSRRTRLDWSESFYPLHVRICAQCLLVQLPAYVAGEDIFSDYLYFSSYSDSWVEHARRYADDMIDRLGLGPDSLVTEVASNDGYLLQHFVAGGVPVLGVEPAGNVAEVARGKGVRTEVAFLGRCDRRGARRAVRPGRPGRRQQRLRARARHRRLLRRSRRAGQADRPGHARVPAPAAAHRAQPVRHHLPRALPVPHAADRVPRAGDRRPDRGRRRRADHARRFAAGARPARRMRPASRRDASRRCSTPRRPPACTRSRARAASPRRSSTIKRDLLDVPDDARAPRASASSATAPRARATRCSTTAASGPTWSTYTVDRSPAQAGLVPARHAHPDPRTRTRIAEDQPGLRAGAAVEPADRDLPSSCPTSGSGAAGWSSRSRALRVV